MLLNDAIERLERLRERRLTRAEEKRAASVILQERIRELDARKDWRKANLFADMLDDAVRSERSCMTDADAVSAVLAHLAERGAP